MPSVETFAELVAVVLAGGKSRRMGLDKATLVYGGRPQLMRAVDLLDAAGLATRVSIRADQSTRGIFRDHGTIVDLPGIAGPAAGVLAAWKDEPSAALLTLAVDLPLVDQGLITALIGGRNPSKLATAFRHPDGTLEPLCTIWEPEARREIETRAKAGSYSLREWLETAEVEVLEPAAPERLKNVNTPAAHEAARRILEGSR